MWQQQLCMEFIFEHERQRDTKTDLHLTVNSGHREALDQNPIAPGSRDEYRIAPLLNRDLLISLFDLAPPGKRRFTLQVRIVTEDERPFHVTHATVSIDVAFQCRACE